MDSSESRVISESSGDSEATLVTVVKPEPIENDKVNKSAREGSHIVKESTKCSSDMVNESTQNSSEMKKVSDYLNIGQPVKRESNDTSYTEDSIECSIQDPSDSTINGESDNVLDPETLPDGLRIVDAGIDDTGLVTKCLWSTDPIPLGTMWGPCIETPVISHSSIEWEKDPEWMSHFRKAAFKKEPSNVEAVRLNGQLYYRTTQEITTPQEIVLSRAEIKDYHGSKYQGRLRQTPSGRKEEYYDYSDAENDSDRCNEESDSDPDWLYQVPDDRCTLNKNPNLMGKNNSADDEYQEDEDMDEADKIDEMEIEVPRMRGKRVIGAKPYVCPERDCDKRFAWKLHLEKHKRTHEAGKPHKCPHCELSFMRRGSLTSHMRVHTGDAPHKCPHCDMGFTRFTSMQSHIRIDHTGEFRHKCNLCGKGFNEPGNLQAHINMHTGTKPHVCPICGKGYASSGAMHCHKQSHVNEKRYKCTQCGRGYLKPEDLARHLETHLRPKPFNCKVCGKGFDHARPMQHHMFTHTGERPLTCHICGKGFIQKINLQRHLQRHANKILHKCETCDLEFNRMDDLRKHRQVHTSIGKVVNMDSQ